MPADAVARRRVRRRARPGVLAGVPVARRPCSTTVLGSAATRCSTRAPTATGWPPGDAALVVRAPVRGLLTAERTALNLLCHLSGVATATAAWVDAVAGTGRADPRHPQDAARAAAAGEVRGALRRRGEPPPRPRRRRADQGQPRGRGRVGRRGAGRGPRGRARPAVRGRGRLARPARRGAGAWTPSWCCWTTSPSPTTAEAVRRRGEPRDAAGVLGRAGAGERRASTPRPASTSSPSAALTHSVTALDLGLDLGLDLMPDHG